MSEVKVLHDEINSAIAEIERYRNRGPALDLFYRLAARVRELEAELEYERKANGALVADRDGCDRRIEQLEAAVRWVVEENGYPFFDAAEDATGSTRADFAVDRWFAAHPVVREVIEKGAGARP